MVCKVLCRIVGLPYVGKSSFFNVLTKTRCVTFFLDPISGFLISYFRSDYQTFIFSAG